MRWRAACTLLAVEASCRDGRSRRTRTGRASGRARRTRRSCTPDASITTISPGSTSRTKCAPTMSSAAVSLASTQPPLEPAEHQRPEAVRVAHADEVRVVHHHEREAALEAAGSTRSSATLEVATVGARLGGVLVGDELGDERGVGGGVEPAVAGASPGSIPRCSASSAVLVRLPLWPSAKPASPTERYTGCALRHVLEPGGGVAVVADGEVAVERREAALVEHLRDEAHVLDHGDGLAVAHRDARPTPGPGAGGRRGRDR